MEVARCCHSLLHCTSYVQVNSRGCALWSLREIPPCAGDPTTKIKKTMVSSRDRSLPPQETHKFLMLKARGRAALQTAALILGTRQGTPKALYSFLSCCICSVLACTLKMLFLRS